MGIVLISGSHGRFKAILFDLGGTLIKTAPIPQILRKILEAHGIQKPITDIVSAHKEIDNQLTLGDYALPSDKFWFKWNMEVLRRLKVHRDLPYLARVISEKWWDFAGIELYPDVIETLNYLRQHEFKTGLVTNGFKSDIDEILPRVGLSRYFDATVGVDAVGKPKPNKEIFLFALNRLNVQPHEAIFVGDTFEIDYEGAEKAGLTALLIDRENKVKSNVKKIGKLTEVKRYLQ